jgi:sirohydrochlorin cobaltochelatase
MKTVVVLAMHGAPPRDFPRQDMAEFFALHSQLERGGSGEREAVERRHAELEVKMRAWPRSAENDPFFAASQELGQHLSQAAGFPVIVGFNEFCAPSLDDALDEAVAEGAEKVIVITPMMTRGGEHSQVDIPDAIKEAQERHPAVTMLYAWPFEVSEVAQFLAEQIERHV